MPYALLNIIPMTLYYWENNEYLSREDVEPGTLFSFIIYDGASDYTPPDGYTLRTVDDDKRIGDFIGL